MTVSEEKKYLLNNIDNIHEENIMDIIAGVSTFNGFYKFKSIINQGVDIVRFNINNEYSGRGYAVYDGKIYFINSSKNNITIGKSYDYDVHLNKFIYYKVEYYL